MIMNSKHLVESELEKEILVQWENLFFFYQSLHHKRQMTSAIEVNHMTIDLTNWVLLQKILIARLVRRLLHLTKTGVYCGVDKSIPWTRRIQLTSARRLLQALYRKSGATGSIRRLCVVCKWGLQHGGCREGSNCTLETWETQQLTMAVGRRGVSVLSRRNKRASCSRENCVWASRRPMWQISCGIVWQLEDDDSNGQWI